MTFPAPYDALLERLASSVRFLPDKPDETPETTLRALWFFALGEPCSAAAAAAREPRALTPTQAAIVESLVDRRCAGEPLSHIVGRQNFMGLEMLAGPEALVPRAETELLARTALDIARHELVGIEKLVIADVCTGSGNIALALASQLPHARVYAADISEQAVAFARRNALHLGLAERVAFTAGDLLEPLRAQGCLGTVDLLSCNPPYISSEKTKSMSGEIREHEPLLAFDGGPFGVSILMRLLQEAPAFLRPGGHLVFEVGLGQGSSMAKRLQVNGNFNSVQTHLDGAGNIRVISAKRS